MLIVKKQLDTLTQKMVEDVKCRRAHELKFQIGNYVNLLLEKALVTQNFAHTIVECGVFDGAALFTLAQFCKEQSIPVHIFGFDSFSGFPEDQASPHDDPNYFYALLEQQEISKEHFERARDRTQSFTDTSPLKKGYFMEIGSVFKLSEKYDNVTLVKGLFSETLPKFENEIAVLHIDCDLYKSYGEVLKNLYSHVVPGGVIIFDEYYSLKYPGARVAVNEFFKDKQNDGFFEVYETSEGFERWCFIKS